MGSALEGRDAPLYAVQFHPEKNVFEWKVESGGWTHQAINHSPDAVKISQSIANFFVSEARKNSNVYDLTETNPPFFEGLASDSGVGTNFVEVYHLFPRGDVAV